MESGQNEVCEIRHPSPSLLNRKVSAAQVMIENIVCVKMSLVSKFDVIKSIYE
ncbi:MAG: hypothetical protein ACXVHV_11490 [Methanobacterium sp.]